MLAAVRCAYVLTFCRTPATTSISTMVDRCSYHFNLQQVRNLEAFSRTDFSELSTEKVLQPILRDFTKAVLRDRPDDVLEYSKAYFVSKWEEQRMGERAPCERRA